jgi:hypothetical protein
MDVMTMREPTEIERQQYDRIGEIAARGRQRYLEAGGDPKRSPSGYKGDDYLTDEERQEILQLSRQVFGVIKQGNQIFCQGKTWMMESHEKNTHRNDKH